MSNFNVPKDKKFTFHNIPFATILNNLVYEEKKKILILGKNSYIGEALKRYLEKFNNYYIEIRSLHGNEWLDSSFEEFDIIFFLVGIAHRAENRENKGLYYEINTKLAINVAEKAKRENVGLFVYVSSMSVYGLVTGHIGKDTKIDPQTHYGISKALAEQELWKMHDNNFGVSIVRPPMVFGYSCTGNYQRLRTYGLKFRIFPKIYNSRSMIYIDNLCSSLRAIMHNKQSGVYCPQNYSYFSTVDMVSDILVANGKKLYTFPVIESIMHSIIARSRLLKKVFGTLVYDKDINVPKEWLINLDNADCVYQGENNGKWNKI